VHTGSINSGHYYCFLNPRQPDGSISNQWYKFNDTVVTKAVTSTAISTGQGGFHSSFGFGDTKTLQRDQPQVFGQSVKRMKAMQTKLVEQIGFEDEIESTDCNMMEIDFNELLETRQPSSTQAYMLVYIRERD
jgi:hypothetical protein